MKYKKILQFVIILILAVLLLSTVSAQDDSENYDPVTLPFTEVRNITSEHVDQDFRLSIALPLSYASSDATYPVLYLLDPDWTFGVATSIRTIGPLPEIIIVGIGYPIDANFTELRERDYVTEADNFLRFIDTELIPFIDSNYRTEPSERAIAGWSFGGYFTLYTLFHNSENFNRYIAISPVLQEIGWYLMSPSGAESIIQHEQEFSDNPTPLFANLFLANGTVDDLPLIFLETFANDLEDRHYLGLEITTVIVEDATHQTVMPAALARGMVEVYCSGPSECALAVPIPQLQLVEDVDFPIGITFITPDYRLLLKSRPLIEAKNAGACFNIEATVFHTVESPDGDVWIQLACGDNAGWVQRSKLED
jgi:hypothetical protein